MSNAATSQGLAGLYARHAPRWHMSITRLGYPQAYDLLARNDLDCRTDPARSVLDAGCGTGAFASAYLDATAPEVPDLTLLDSSPEMLAHACAQHPHAAEVICDDLHHLIQMPARFDTVLCAHVLEHLDDLKAGLSLLRSVLAPGGSLLLSVSKPHWCTALIRWRWGHKAYRPEEVIATLDAQGFEQIENFAFVKGPPSRTSHGYRAVRPLI